ncbi:MAG: hypothetical protein IKM25_04945 [Clostridia bacterium]|nr:hypothetical protein [Clostridia bacterium]
MRGGGAVVPSAPPNHSIFCSALCAPFPKGAAVYENSTVCLTPSIL